MLGKAKIKYIQSLGQKKQGDEDGLFIADGPKIINELLHSVPQKVKEVYAVKEWLKENGDDVHQGLFNEVSAEELEKLSQLNIPNEALGVEMRLDTGRYRQ